jgi:hypothetical protein
MCLKEDGTKRLFTKMMNGRNAEGNQGALFHPNGK